MGSVKKGKRAGCSVGSDSMDCTPWTVARQAPLSMGDKDGAGGLLLSGALRVRVEK